ncbi:GTP-binding protein LepA [Candidatus Mycoplasma haematolamae str. Purdue]|uniref:GTP-binding protein LepA n=1 Tax=Mycoplasma haematolamae (strain Purdue) TaxID=1212765 RepID=I7C541_MYCHA|nr:GTP-binding protein [Candidatus Mycoplasma haematolamae]AFO51612.1 GTP-binding protein LepA [Candidatus Mycoplasma haematolamae str. Purdue]
MKIRNFCIVAHIDHGKSTLSDRIIESCLGLPLSSISNCFLDSMELEKEKGITIKLAAIRLKWKDCYLNLIDTPGHIDFSAEVFRSLKVSEAALLLVDLTKGVQAQTISLFNKARDEKLKIIPVLNKIDSPLVTEGRKKEIVEMLSNPPFSFSDFIYISAKTGQGVKELLDKLTEEIPEPRSHKYCSELSIPFIQRGELCALVFEAEYHAQKGTILTVRLFSGEIVAGQEVYLVNAKLKARVREIEFLTPKSEKSKSIKAGEVGRVYVFLPKTVQLDSGEHICTSPPPHQDELSLLPKTSSMSTLKPMIFSFIAPYEETQRALFLTSLSSLRLSDSSFQYKLTQSSALGFGANIGALGPLHLEVLVSRLEKEFKLKLISGPSTIEYKALMRNGETMYFSSAAQMPDQSSVKEFSEPYILLTLSLPTVYERDFIAYISSRRSTSLISLKREGIEQPTLITEYLIPLGELNSSFVHSLYSITKGYITYSYVVDDYYPLSLSKVNICINNLDYPELSFLAESSEAIHKAREILLKLKQNLSPELYELALQGKIGGKIIARETVKPQRKAVAAKCYGGDISRKKKLWERQAQGKKRMKETSKLKLPHSFFSSLISTNKS